MVEKFLMSSTKATDLSKFSQFGARASRDVVRIACRRDRDRGLERGDRARAITEMRVLASQLVVRRCNTRTDTLAARGAVDQQLPRRGAGAMIVKVLVLNLGDALHEQ